MEEIIAIFAFTSIAFLFFFISSLLVRRSSASIKEKITCNGVLIDLYPIDSRVFIFDGLHDFPDYFGIVQGCQMLKSWSCDNNFAYYRVHIYYKGEFIKTETFSHSEIQEITYN